MTDALTMPRRVADLIKLSLSQIGLTAHDDEPDLITSPLLFEDGTVLSFAVMCVSQRRLFWAKPMLLTSVVKLDAQYRANHVFLRNVMFLPKAVDDLEFKLKFISQACAMGWAVAAAAGFGECVNLPQRPAAEA